MRKDRLAWLALFIVCFFWGTTYLAIRIGVRVFPPFLFSGLRLLAGGFLLFLIWYFKKNRSSINWKIIGLNSLAGFLFFTLGVGMVGWAEQFIPSGLAALLCSFPPIWLVLLNVFIFRVEKINPTMVIGILLGFGGMILVFREHIPDLLHPEYALAVGVTIMANISWVIASLFLKKNTPSGDSLLNAFIQMLAGGLVLMLFSLAFERNIPWSWTPPAVYSLIYLIVFGSVITFWAYLYALSHLPITLVSLHNYINVLVAILLGSLILKEGLNPFIFISVLITLTGIYFVHKGLKINQKA
jgi:drug/metabolite transporter (DMT)-like permease